MGVTLAGFALPQRAMMLSLFYIFSFIGTALSIPFDVVTAVEPVSIPLIFLLIFSSCRLACVIAIWRLQTWGTVGYVALYATSTILAIVVHHFVLWQVVIGGIVSLVALFYSFKLQ